MKSQGHARWITVGICFATFAVWASFSAILIRNQGDHMIGFHPVILAIIPGVLVGAISAIICLLCRQWQIGCALALGAFTLFWVLRNSRLIEERAWQDAIISNAKENERALTYIQGDLKGDDLSLLWKEEKLQPMEGFRWFGTNHFSAPNGVYSGFRIAGVPHARVQKIRHGWKGVALIHSDSALTTLAAHTGMAYSRVGSSDWFIWSTESCRIPDKHHHNP